MSLAPPPLPFTAEANFSFRFSCPAHAEIAFSSLSVDAELSPERSTKILSLDGALLICKFTATDTRALRVTISAFCDMLCVVVRMLRDFGDDAASLI